VSHLTDGTGLAMRIGITSKDHIIHGGEFRDSLDFCGTALKPAATTDLFLSSVDTTGKLDWIIRGYASGDAWMTALAVDHSDNIYVVAHSYDTLVFGNATIKADQYSCGVAAKFSDKAIMLWHKTFQGYAFANGVATDAYGNVYFSLLHYLLKCDFKNSSPSLAKSS